MTPDLADPSQPWPARGTLPEIDGPLAAGFDVALLDLDGTIYVGAEPVPGAGEVVGALPEHGTRPAFVTNNASRTPESVADQLVSLGISATADDVVTSGQAAALELARMLPGGAAVLVVGGDGLRQAVAAAGLVPVTSAADAPAAVVQGWTPELSWSQLAEGAYALASGVPWVATNTDASLPTPRGIAPGNGSFVSLLAGVSGRNPDLVAGKPSPPLLRWAVARLRASRPLVVGDRLDTDIAGAARLGLPSLLVLTGVTDLRALFTAAADQRPTFVSRDLSGLLAAHRQVLASGSGWACGRAFASVEADGQLLVRPDPRADSAAVTLDALRACCAAAWAAADRGHQVTVGQPVLERLRSVSPSGSATGGDPGSRRPA
jgi:glycerol-1-phosphatase